MAWKTIEEFSQSKNSFDYGLSAEVKNEIVEKRLARPRPQPPIRPKVLKKKPLKHSCLFTTSNFEKKPAKLELLIGEESPENLVYSSKCFFCKTTICSSKKIARKSSHLQLGLMVTKRGLDFAVHQHCMDYAESQYMIQDLDLPPEATLDGFPLQSILDQVKNKTTKCCYCSRGGATTTCANVKCQKKGWYHLPCGINNGSLQVNHEVNGKTVCKSYCPNHRPDGAQRKKEIRTSTGFIKDPNSTKPARKTLLHQTVKSEVQDTNRVDDDECVIIEEKLKSKITVLYVAEIPLAPVDLRLKDEPNPRFIPKKETRKSETKAKRGSKRKIENTSSTLAQNLATRCESEKRKTRSRTLDMNCSDTSTAPLSTDEAKSEPPLAATTVVFDWEDTDGESLRKIFKSEAQNKEPPEPLLRYPVSPDSSTNQKEAGEVPFPHDQVERQNVVESPSQSDEAPPDQAVAREQDSPISSRVTSRPGPACSKRKSVNETLIKENDKLVKSQAEQISRLKDKVKKLTAQVQINNEEHEELEELREYKRKMEEAKRLLLES